MTTGRPTATTSRGPSPPPPRRGKVLPPGREETAEESRSGLEARVDVDLRSRAGVKLAAEGLRGTVEAHEHLRERPGVDAAVRVVPDGGREARRCPEDAGHREVVERDITGVDEAGGPGQADVYDLARRLREPQGLGGD